MNSACRGKRWHQKYDMYEKSYATSMKNHTIFPQILKRHYSLKKKNDIYIYIYIQRERERERESIYICIRM